MPQIWVWPFMGGTMVVQRHGVKTRKSLPKAARSASAVQAGGGVL